MIEPHHAPKKFFGQHFLHDDGVIARIVRAVDPQPGERLVEIGPGRGAITLPLLQQHGELTVIELDRDLLAHLRMIGKSAGKLEIIHANVLDVDFAALAAADRLRLVGNLPYNISTPILFHVLAHAAAIEDMHFMLQKEVVDRMAATPGGKVYGRLSVMLQACCEVTPLFEVPPSAFRPPPQVDSAVVRLRPRAPQTLAIANRGLFERVVRDAFGQRRKTLRNALSGLCAAADIEAAGLRPQARAEELAVTDFIALANHLAAHRQPAGTIP